MHLNMIVNKVDIRGLWQHEIMDQTAQQLNHQKVVAEMI